MMRSARRLSGQVLAALRNDKILWIRAGKEHRFIGIWAVVVSGRVFVRSWTVKPTGWFQTLQNDPRGSIRVGNREVRIRAVNTRSERLKNAVDRAYFEKYTTPASLKYCRGFKLVRRRHTTTELVPR